MKKLFKVSIAIIGMFSMFSSAALANRGAAGTASVTYNSASSATISCTGTEGCCYHIHYLPGGKEFLQAFDKYGNVIAEGYVISAYIPPQLPPEEMPTEVEIETVESNN